MIYIFKDNQLIGTGKDTEIPINAYMYNSFTKEWYVRGLRAYLRPVKPKHVPKWIRVVCLLNNIQLES